MLRDKKGVTLVVLIISIIIMFIIFGITMNTGTELFRTSDKNRLKTNLYLIKARASSLLEDYLFDETSKTAYDNLGDDKSTSDQITAVGFIEDASRYIYATWDSDKLEEQGISTENIAATELFIVQYDIENDKVDVASTKGFEDEDGKIIYTLSELEND